MTAQLARLRIPKTSGFRFALTYAILFSVSVVLILTILYWSTIGILAHETNATIEAEIEGLAEQYRQRGLDGLIEVVAQRVRRNRDGRSVYLFADRRLQPLAGNLDRWPAGVTHSSAWVDFRRTADGGEVVPVRARVLAITPELTLLVGRDIRELARIHAQFREAATLGIAATLILGILGGIWLGRVTRRRITEINQGTRRIVAGALEDRLPDPGGDDEYAELVANLNAMFDEISRLLDGLRHTGDSIAHDLRTPLTRLRNRLDSLSRLETVDGAEIRECLQEADSLLATFAAILRIARLEAGAYRSQFEPVNLRMIVSDVCELYQAAAEDDGITLLDISEEDAWTMGDRELIAQALANLLDNALKYGGSGGVIEVRARADDRNVTLSVADRGPGIPAEGDRDRIAQRFVRLESARLERGNGLGLALVKAVVEQHKGTMLICDNEPGLRVELAFPATR